MSDETKLAQEAAEKIYAGYFRRANSCEPGATAIVQAAIDNATAALREENKRLKKMCSLDEQSLFSCEVELTATKQRAEAAEAERDGLRERVEAIKPPEHYQESCTCYGCRTYREVAAALTPPASESVFTDTEISDTEAQQLDAIRQSGEATPTVPGKRLREI